MFQESKLPGAKAAASTVLNGDPDKTGGGSTGWGPRAVQTTDTGIEHTNKRLVRLEQIKCRH